MPYELKKVRGGYQVSSKDTGKTHSNKPLSRGKAKAQMRAMYANVKDANVSDDRGVGKDTAD